MTLDIKKKTLPDSTTIASILFPADLTDEQVCKIIIGLAKMVIEENGKDIKFKKGGKMLNDNNERNEGNTI